MVPSKIRTSARWSVDDARVLSHPCDRSAPDSDLYSELGSAARDNLVVAEGQWLKRKVFPVS